MSYLTQMAGLAYHNFLSAAMGIAVAVALIRAIKRTSSATIGNFWVDTTRTLLYVLLPASIDWRAADGRPRRSAEPERLYRGAYAGAAFPDADHRARPVASQEVIKMLGTNGGGFFNANSAHPFENPTPLTNLFQTVSDLRDSGGAYLYAGPHDRLAGPRMGRSGRHVCALRGGIHHRLLGRVAASSADPRRRSKPARADRARRQHGGQRGAQRHCRKLPVRHYHHGRQLRRRQRHARQLYRAGRHGGAHQPDDGRGGLWRRGLRPLRHVDHGGALGLRRWPYGGPNP
jgi:hypothetical protein